jgi:lipoprotein-releasing system ATP-binding protein
MEKAVRAVGVFKSYPGTEGPLEVLRGVDLEVESGEMVAVVGASGVGKSTLLHILGTLDRPDRGRVEILGRLVFEVDERERNRLRREAIGFVFQFHFLLPEFTALENVAMPALVAGRPADLAQRRARELLETVGLGHRLGHRPHELSGGEQQRVALARAFVNEPAVIFADEPTGNLDEQASEELHELMCRMVREEGRTFVVVTHKRELARRADRVCLLREGRLHPWRESDGELV